MFHLSLDTFWPINIGSPVSRQIFTDFFLLLDTLFELQKIHFDLCSPISMHFLTCRKKGSRNRRNSVSPTICRHFLGQVPSELSWTGAKRGVRSLLVSGQRPVRYQKIILKTFSMISDLEPGSTLPRSSKSYQGVPTKKNVTCCSFKSGLCKRRGTGAHKWSARAFPQPSLQPALP